MNSWSLDSLQQRLGRKVVPEGSNHFQQVLDQILCRHDKDQICFYNSNATQQSDTIVAYDTNEEEGHDANDRTADLSKECITDCMFASSDTRDNNNNNSQCVYEIKCNNIQCQQDQLFHGSHSNKSEASKRQHYLEHHLYTSHTEPTTDIDTFPESDQELRMGASCSSNNYDNRQWLHLKADGSQENAQPKKRGRLLKKLVSNDKHSDNNQVPSDVCQCLHHQSKSLETEPASRPLDLHRNGLNNAFDKRSSLSPEDIILTCGQQLTSNRLSPNVDSSGHVQLTRVVGTGRARATASCDVSPHRLLTRRNNSPNGRSSSMDAKTASYYEERQRSCSWSNGKLGTKTSFKTNSLTVGSSNPVRIMKTFSPQPVAERISQISPTSSSATAKTLSKTSKVENHAAECPLHLKQEYAPKISVSNGHGQEETDADLVPVLRRRAASESQTLRPRRILPRTPDACDQIQEHVHVRWADEKHGSSLSTSVFLSSIRPRSYSYGAVDAPQRPILKKVAGF